MNREARIVLLLRTYTEARDPLAQTGSDVHSGLDSRLLLMNPLWREGSYAELEECLRFMRMVRLRLYTAIAERYIRCERRPRWVRRTNSGVWFDHPSGRLAQQQQRFLNAEVGGGRRGSISEHRRLVEYWKPVFEGDVSMGLRFLVEKFPGEVRVPKVLTEGQLAA